MHSETLKILRDLIDWINQLKAERYGHRRLGGLEQEEYLHLLNTVDAANRHLVILQRALEDEKKTVF
jgi:hypothetical protein